MKIKWNWGTKLALWITAFILFILTLVLLSLKYDIGLVEKDYYPKGLVYQNRIDAIENALEFSNIFKFAQNEKDVIIETPEIEVDEGTVTFFRPSDNSFDRVYELHVADNKNIIIPKSDLIVGKYLVKFEWKHLNKNYYVEKVFVLK